MRNTEILFYKNSEIRNTWEKLTLECFQVAMLCPEKGELASRLFHNKFLSSSGEKTFKLKFR